MSGFPGRPRYLESTLRAEFPRLVVVADVNIDGQSMVFRKLPDLLGRQDASRA